MASVSSLSSSISPVTCFFCKHLPVTAVCSSVIFLYIGLWSFISPCWQEPFAFEEVNELPLWCNHCDWMWSLILYRFIRSWLCPLEIIVLEGFFVLVFGLRWEMSMSSMHFSIYMHQELICWCVRNVSAVYRSAIFCLIEFKQSPLWANSLSVI